MWSVYVLQSRKDGGFYVGMASDVEQRVRDHNRGYNRSTQARRPFELFYVEECGSSEEARKREKFLKSGQGREFLKARAEQELRPASGG
jgi:putative endonuclease